MKAKVIILGLAILSFSATQASAQLVVTAPVLEVQSGVQTGLQNTMKGLSKAANVLVKAGVKEQELTKVFSEKNLQLAKNWYDGLQQVSATVRTYRRVQSVFEKQGQIIQTYATAIETLRQSPYVQPEQLSTMTSVYSKMLTEGANTVSDLQTIVSPAMLKMTDAERMRFIDKLDAKISDQLSLINYYTQRNYVQMHLAEQKAQDTQALHALMGVR
ncbi:MULTISPECIES: hypothetical protein [Hymenobacter]|uniref:Conjugal transfer protein TraI n=1 Tax=Hymenobacter psychrotolerans DSM 18569 TaxID=1121959 RepID=A0A1M6ZY00_9BACT|nr:MULTISPECIES: hypothetical protein [Hymenobacter]QNE42160.1 hypothetical protein F1C16_21320 [Hymenobacter sp. NBH84]SHL35398.1 hypothetical protein SAMN02746009_02606 [Hymenobacter psychrotolerans DSM 18569]